MRKTDYSFGLPCRRSALLPSCLREGKIFLNLLCPHQRVLPVPSRQPARHRTGKYPESPLPSPAAILALPRGNLEYGRENGEQDTWILLDSTPEVQRSDNAPKLHLSTWQQSQHRPTPSDTLCTARQQHTTYSTYARHSGSDRRQQELGRSFVLIFSTFVIWHQLRWHW